MPPALGKKRKEVSLTPKQITLLNQLSIDTSKSESEVVGQLIENYAESFKRKFGS